MSVLSLVDVETGEICEPVFGDFWLLYPRRVAKKEAEKAWIRLTDRERIAALTAMVEWRRVWADKDLDFVPHAATWLRGARWEDELPAAFTQSAAAHRPAEIPAKGERTALPDHVRALLAKLRGSR